MRFETLAAGVLLAAVAATATRAAIELPAITVTGKVTPSGDTVSRDRARRSPDIHWHGALSPDSLPEIFAHNGIEINAPLATVWNHLVQARLWPQWYPDVGKVKIKDGSQTLQKGSRFTWSGFDLPLDNRFGSFPSPLESQVVECVPESRISWVSYAGPTTEGPLCDMYHTWLLTPTGTKRCHVIFEEVATGLAALHARGFNPEILHVSHQGWLERLKKIQKPNFENKPTRVVPRDTVRLFLKSEVARISRSPQAM